MPTLTSGGMTLLSGANYLTSSPTVGGGDDVPLAVTVDQTNGNTTCPTSIDDIDATNFNVAFTAPASGKVIVVMSGTVHFDSAVASRYVIWGLRSGSTTIDSRPVGFSKAVTNDYRYLSVRFFVSGLTPGNSYTYKGAHQVSAGTDSWTIGDSAEYKSLEVWEDAT